MPRTDNIGITFGCNGQCTITTQFQDNQCVNRFKELGIHCNQTECSPRNFDLSACITAENEITTTNQNCNCQCSTRSNRDAVTSGIAVVQSKASTSTMVYRTETTSRTEAQNVSCTIQPLSSTEAQCHRIIGALAGLVMVLLVMAIIPWIWICWRFKLNRGLKRDIQQARYTKQP